MDSLKNTYSPSCPTTLRPAGGHPWNSLMAVPKVATHRTCGRPTTPLDTPCHTPLKVISSGGSTAGIFFVSRRRFLPEPKKDKEIYITQAKAPPQKGTARTHQFILDLKKSDRTWPELIWPDLTCSDEIWCDLMWSDVIWCDLMWSNLIWSDLIWPDLTLWNLTDLIGSDLTWSYLIPIWPDLIWLDPNWSDLIWP
jgi:hypothetical protein